MSAPLVMPDVMPASAPLPECVREVCVSAVRAHEVGQIFDVEHIALSKVTIEHEFIHPMGVLTWMLMFTVATTNGNFFWMAKVSASAVDEPVIGELSYVRVSVFDPVHDRWAHATTYEHPGTAASTNWLSHLNGPDDY